MRRGGDAETGRLIAAAAKVHGISQGPIASARRRDGTYRPTGTGRPAQQLRFAPEPEGAAARSRGHLQRTAERRRPRHQRLAAERMAGLSAVHSNIWLRR